MTHPQLELDDLRESLTSYLQAELGELEGRHVEIVSGDPPIDLLVVAPTPERSCRVVVTCGMAAAPMAPPPELAPYRRAELLLCLPEGWPLGGDAGRAASWPLGMLRRIARIPQQLDAWLFAGHTTPNGDPPESWGPATELCGAIVTQPWLVFDGQARVDLGADERVDLLAVLPLYEGELRFKLDCGGAALVERLREAGVTELLDPVRPSVAPERWGPATEELEAFRIVPAHEDEDPDLEFAQAMLVRAGLGADDAENGAWLAPSQGVAIYTRRYYRELSSRLETAVDDDEGVPAILDGVRADLQAGVFPY